ncbi:hypothetical protein [Limnohabitans sp.]|jgi:hypothetical protein|uniref:hypothetical protein n=1 Tax=Limnohabitans sp. TaxID=1907725 RepID=UPI00286F1770|nr:hypothetical protein [Limnohabitans sp.]
MSTEPQFLSFKGLKQYTPEEGWGQVNAILQSHTQPAAQAPVPENVPTLTEHADAQERSSPIFDPLINELFEQLRVAPSDELTQTWRTIAAEVNLLTQRMALQRELQERLLKLDQDLLDLRGTILSHLSDVQQAADQQLSSARLRAEVSALAQSKLAAKLTPKP